MPAPWKGKSSDESAEPGKKIKTDRIDLETCHFEVELRFHRSDKKIEWKGTTVDVIQRFTVMFPILNHTAPAGTHQRPSQRHPITRSYHYHNQWIICSDLSSSLSLSYRLIRALVITGGLQGLAAHSGNLMIQWIFRFPTLNKTNGAQVVWIPWLWNIWTTTRKRLQRIFYPCLTSPSYTRWNCVDLRDINLDFPDSLLFSRQRV